MHLWLMHQCLIYSIDNGPAEVCYIKSQWYDDGTNSLLSLSSQYFHSF